MTNKSLSNTWVLFISALCFALLSSTQAKRRSVWKTSEASFDENNSAVQVRKTNLGEKEIRTHLKDGARFIETTEPSRGENFPYVREAVKNNRFVWIVYQDNHHIIDCNISTNAKDVDKFEQKFKDIKPDPMVKESSKADGSDPKFGFRTLLQECRSFKRQFKVLRRAKHQSHQNNKSEQSHRSKRGAFSMIYPGTKWCGAGDEASGGYDDMGENVATDRCCREHDHCPYYISGFSTDFNYWNYRFHTLLHCSCEERFKSCLESAGNSIAHMVGYIYFNYVGKTCFNLKPKKTCKERSWWGTCNKYATEYTAAIVDTDLHF